MEGREAAHPTPPCETLGRELWEIAKQGELNWDKKEGG